MSEPQVPKQGSVPAALQGRPRAGSPASQRYRLVKRVALGVVIALLSALQVGALIWGIGPALHRFRAALSVDRTSFTIDHLTCVSVNDVKYDAKEFSDPQLTDAVVETLGIKTVLFNADYEACPWVLFLAVALEEEPTGRRDRSAVYAISSRICARSTDGAAKPDDCISRNIHIVPWRAAPHELFTIGLQALTLRQIGSGR